MSKHNYVLSIARVIIPFLLFSASSFAQTTVTTQLGNMIATFSNTGRLFLNMEEGTAGFEVPAGGGVSSIYCSNLWIGGLDDTLGLHLAASRFGIGDFNEETGQADSSQEFTPGPLTLNGTTNQILKSNYNYVYLANRDDVENHINYFNAIQNGTAQTLFPNGYSTPQWMLDWPVAFPDTLCGGSAPFMDTDANGLYNPQNGDYPCFKGDECAFMIFNDNGGVHSESEGTPLKITVQLMLYAYNGLGEDIANTLFANYTIFNCSNESYQEAYIGNWTDFDIGTPFDDFIASHISGGFYYAHNGDPFDEPSTGTQGYGSATPVQSVVFLQGPKIDSDSIDNALTPELTSFTMYGPYGPGYGDGIIDNEHLGMSNFVYYNNSTNPINGEPATAQHHYNYMQSKWKNGQAMQFGGNGVSGAGVVADLNARYMFPGNSDPHNINTNGIVPPPSALPWTEVSAGNAPNDRRGIAASGPFSFAAGDTITFDLAFQYSEESGTLLDEVTLAYINSNLAREVFSNNALNCNDSEIVLAVNNTSGETNNIELYPNPTRDFIRFKGFTGHSSHYIIEDVSGRMVQSGTSTFGHSINIEKLQPGQYILRLCDDDGKTMAIKRMQKIAY